MPDTTTDITNKQLLNNELDEVILQSSGVFYGGKWFFPSNPDLIIQKHGMKIYERMLTDATVKAALRSKVASIQRLRNVIEPASKDEGDIKIAKFIDYCFEKMRGTKRDLIYNLLDALPFGYSVIEKVGMILSTGNYAGNIAIQELAPKDPNDFKFNIDEKGRLDNIQNYLRNGQTKLVPKDKVIMYVYQQRYRLPWGSSDLRPAYKHWWAKDFLLKFWAIFCETHAIPPRIAYIPRNSFYDDANKAKMLNVLKHLKSASSLHVPDDVKIEFAEIQKGMPFDEALRYHDEQLVKCILNSSLSVEKGTGNGGGLAAGALGTVHETTKLELVEAIAHDIEDVINEQLIRPLVDLNYIVDSYPRFKFVFDTSDINIVQAQDIATLIQAGVLDAEKDAETIRARLGFPPLESRTIVTNEPNESPMFDLTVSEQSTEQGVPQNAVTHGQHNHAKRASQPGFPFWREPNKHEMSANIYSRFAGVESAQKLFLDTLSPIIEKLKEKFLRHLDKRVFVDGHSVNLKAVENLDIAGWNQFADTFVALSQAYLKNESNEAAKVVKLKPVQFNYSMNDDDAQIDENKFANVVKLSAVGAPPVTQIKQMKKWKEEKNWEKIKGMRDRKQRDLQTKMKSRAFWVTGLAKEDILKDVKKSIYTGLSNMKSYADIAKSVDGVFEKYIARGETLPEELSTAPRLETIVRTNISNLMNAAHKEIYQDPLVTDQFNGMQFTAIMDFTTCEICAGLDGTVYQVDDPIWDEITPPIHMNCNCSIVPVPTDEIEKFDDKQIANDALDEIYVDFGGRREPKK